MAADRQRWVNRDRMKAIDFQPDRLNAGVFLTPRSFRFLFSPTDPCVGFGRQYPPADLKIAFVGLA